MAAAVGDRFREALKVKQAEAYTIPRFAALLGIYPSTWSKIKSGQRRPGRKVIMAALRTWPELAHLLTLDSAIPPEGGNGHTGGDDAAA